MADSGSQKFIRYADIDVLYEGHQFCDNWPNWKSDAWFFAPAGGDATETGISMDWNYPPAKATVDLTTINPNTSTDDADETSDWGQMFMCGFAQLYALNESLYQPVSQVVTSDPSNEDAGIVTTFHPKTVALGSEVYKVWLH